MKLRSPASSLFACIASLTLWSSGAARAQQPDAAPLVVQEASSFWSRIFAESTPTISVRLRTEFADVKGLDEGIAYTARARGGVRTRDFKGLAAYVEAEHNEVFGRQRFNAAGVHGPDTKAVVADPENTEFTQAYLTYTLPKLQLKLGRQKIILGEGVFVGDIDFRNNGQSFDAFTVSTKPSERLELFYSYIYNVNRIFGATEGRDNNFDSRSNLVQATYRVSDLLNARAFGYLFDLQQNGTDARSSDTLGLSLTGSRVLGAWQLGYRADYAVQSGAANAPIDYHARYYFLSATAATRGVELSAGRERFGADDGNGFTNTLDTTFRDLFIVTPVNGLNDDFVQLGTLLGRGLAGQVQVHRFTSASEGLDYGVQVQGVLRQELSKNIAVLARAFSYRDDQPGPMGNPLPVDTFRASLQIDFQFN